MLLEDPTGQITKKEAIQLIKTCELCNLLRISRTTQWRLQQREPGFPKPLKIAQNQNLWNLQRVTLWLERKDSGEI